MKDYLCTAATKCDGKHSLCIHLKRHSKQQCEELGYKAGAWLECPYLPPDRLCRCVRKLSIDIARC